MSNCCASSASVFSPLTAARATFALNAGEWFRRGRLLIVSPALQPSWPPSGRNATYLTCSKIPGQLWPEWVIARGYRALLYGLFFSVLSAFHIGWKELSVGSWIARLNPYEYTLKATGWVRTISGVQSLISVYLLALAI